MTPRPRPAPAVTPLESVPSPRRGGTGTPTTATAPPRFAALGDSLTFGIGDPVDSGAWRGWATLLGAAFGDEDGTAFRNFAVSGALTRDVEERQTPDALAFAPDIASVVVGVNDTLRRAFDIQDLAPRIDRICAALAAHGTVLLTACLPDPGAMLGLPAPLARPLARRQRAVNAVVHTLATRYDTVHLHLADTAWVADRTLWSADRLHPGERGHRMIAVRFHAALTARGFALGPPPDPDPDRSPPTRAESLRWLATSGTGWVARRCRDLLPELLRLAGDEVTHWARGSSARLDLKADHALSGALAALAAPAAGKGN
ncbi:SGNH/GDSL hydrolase family protein [Streptomyces sp. NPDC096310]|uniref:SGNH/GDSL hydrolase family protein n=1 Tax=Streptomyces sp. NPDC096310 TaxID=3366082 RepID=UPI003827C2FF